MSGRRRLHQLVSVRQAGELRMTRNVGEGAHTGPCLFSQDNNLRPLCNNKWQSLSRAQTERVQRSVLAVARHKKTMQVA